MTNKKLWQFCCHSFFVLSGVLLNDKLDRVVLLTGYPVGVVGEPVHDLELAQRYAFQNRTAMADNILEAAGLGQRSRFDTVHNYIDLDHMIARKGAISAQKDEIIIIPFNMITIILLFL